MAWHETGKSSIVAKFLQEKRVEILYNSFHHQGILGYGDFFIFYFLIKSFKTFMLELLFRVVFLQGLMSL